MIRLRLPLPRFVSTGEIFTGAGCIAALKGLDAVKAAIVVSGSLWRDMRISARLEQAVNAHSKRTIVLPSGEPSLERLGPALREIASFKPDWIIAVGGGSVIDAGKILWAQYEHPDVELSRYARPFSLPTLRGKARFAALPTTAGTGSEVSSSALLSIPEGGKVAIVSHELLPDLAILDPELTTGVPVRAMAFAGLDALSHALESYVSRFPNTLADQFAEQAARTLFRVLPITIRDPFDLKTRLEAMEASLLAGWVQNQKVPGVGHAVAHQLGSFGVAHGAATGALLGAAIRFNSRESSVRCKYDRLGAALGLVGCEGLLDAVENLRRELGAADCLASMIQGGRERVFGSMDQIAAGAITDVCARANPVLLDREAVGHVLNEALSR